MGMVVKAKIGELEEKVREGFPRKMSKELIVVVQGVYGNKRFLARFQDGCENDLTSDQLTIVIVEKIPMEEEPEVSTIPEIPEDQVTSEKGYYHNVYDIINFNKEDGVDRKEEQADV